MDLIRALEANTADLLMEMGTAGGGEQRDDGLARWTIGGSPIEYHNAVVAASGVEVVAESVEAFRRRGVPGSWHVGPAMRSGELVEALLAAGFTAAGAEPGMAVRLEELVAPAVVPGLQVERVEDEKSLAVWEATLGQGFGEGVVEARWVASVYRQLGYGDQWRHYLGFVDGVPVATATVFLGAGVAGLYFVMTVPEARRRGIGAAVTYAVLREAAGVAEYAVLGASSAGQPVYARLGFEEVCSIDLFEWRSSR